MICIIYVEYPLDGPEQAIHMRQMDGMIERVVGESAVHTGAFLLEPRTRDMEFEVVGKENAEEIVERLRDEIHKSCGPLFLEEFVTTVYTDTKCPKCDSRIRETEEECWKCGVKITLIDNV